MIRSEIKEENLVKEMEEKERWNRVSLLKEIIFQERGINRSYLTLSLKIWYLKYYLNYKWDSERLMWQQMDLPREETLRRGKEVEESHNLSHKYLILNEYYLEEDMLSTVKK